MLNGGPANVGSGGNQLDALSITNLVANIFLGIGSFCLGFAVNIFVSYSGASQLTAVGDFMLHRCSIVALGAAVISTAQG